MRRAAPGREGKWGASPRGVLPHADAKHFGVIDVPTCGAGVVVETGSRITMREDTNKLRAQQGWSLYRGYRGSGGEVLEGRGFHEIGACLRRGMSPERHGGYIGVLQPALREIRERHRQRGERASFGSPLSPEEPLVLPRARGGFLRLTTYGYCTRVARPRGERPSVLACSGKGSSGRWTRTDEEDTTRQRGL